MATIGSISVAFEADLGNFQAGIDSVVSSLDGLAARVEQLSARMGDLSSASVSIDIDSSSVDPASRAVESLSESLEETSKVVEASSDTIKSFSSEVSEALSAAKADALEGTEAYIEMRDSLASLRNISTGTLNAISSTAARSSSAVTGLSNAVESISEGRGLQTVADSSIVAAGRISDAYQSIASLFSEVIPNAFVATGTAVTTLASTMGGLATVSAAFAGSAAAASIVISSLAAAAASAGVAILTYAGIVTAARIASSGLSEEAQAYVERAAGYIGATVSVAAAARASAVVLRVMTDSISEASSVSQGLANALRALTGSVLGLVPAAVTLANILGVITVSLDLVDAASRRSTAGFVAAAARAAVFSTAIGAVTGGVSAYVAGTSVMAGVTAGASAAIGGLIANFPVFATLAVAAAVATGRVEKALGALASQAQQTADFADRFGQSTQEMEKLQIAARNAGVAFTGVVRASQVFQTNLSKVKVGQLGTPQAREAKAAFDRLGISMDTLRNSDPQKVFETVGEALKNVEDPAKRTQIAMDLFGRTGPSLLPLLKNLKEMNKDIERLGGTVRTLDFERFQSLNTSFDRLRTASDNLSRALFLPFVRMQEAFNNAMADIKGGLTPVFSVLGSAIADATAPLAVMIEIVGRLIGIVARIAGAAARMIEAFLPLAAVAALAQGIRDGFMLAMEPIEKMVSVIEAVAQRFFSFLNPASSLFVVLGKAIGLVVGGLAQLLVYVALGAAAWAVYSVAVAVVTGFSISATVAFIAMWVAALGPAALVVAGLAAIGGAITLVVAGVSSLVEWLFSFGESAEQIDGATASVDQLAEAVSEVDRRRELGFKQDLLDLAEAAGFTQEELEQAFSDFSTSVAGGFSAATGAVGEFLGFSEEQVEAFNTAITGAVTAVTDFVGITGEPKIKTDSLEEAKKSIAGARDAMEDLSIRAAQLGPAGVDAAAASSEQFTELQRKLAAGKVTLTEFNDEAARIRSTLGDSLDAISKGSPEETLKKNIELFKSLDDAAKQAAKSARDIGADVVIGDKIFPRSEEVKERAKEYAEEYSSALDDIKKKLASGGFQKEIDEQRAELSRAFSEGEISQETFKKKTAELDRTSAQEQASIAAEEVQRELDKKQALLKVELDFADGIRKRLEEAFLSPVDKFQKELDKIQTNIDLTPEQKELAEKDLRKTAREQIIGQTATERFSDRERDISQALDSGLITDQEAQNEIKKNADELAKALGIPVNPANQMEVAVSQLDAALKAGKISVEQHAEGLKVARRSFLESLGIKPRAEELDADRAAELDKQFAAKKISEEEFQRGKQAIENDIVGQSAADRISDQRRRINAGIESGAVDSARGEAALRGLDADRRRAVGVEDSPAQQLQGGIDKINDAFGVAGLEIADIANVLSPEEFAEYQEAIKKNSEAVKASLGVEKSGADRLAESRQKLDDALRDGIISQEERDKAVKKQRDELLSSLGITKSPSEDFQDAVARIKENAAELTPEEMEKGIKEAKDKLLSALGIPKSPVEEVQRRLDELADAFGEGSISAEELAKGAKAAKDSLLQSLGIPLDPVAQFAERMSALDDALQKGLISQEQFSQGQEEARRAMLPGGDEKSPIKQFQEDIDAITRARDQGLISEEDFAKRRLNLQAGLEDSIGSALDGVGQDRRQVGASDVRSQSGVDTFFRILQGRDNPSLKAQLEIAKNTKLLADASQDPDAAPVIANFAAR
jgi:predicted RNA-binding protein associated with RNAse of E/G family